MQVTNKTWRSIKQQFSPYWFRTTTNIYIFNSSQILNPIDIIPVSNKTLSKEKKWADFAITSVTYKVNYKLRNKKLRRKAEKYQTKCCKIWKSLQNVKNVVFRNKEKTVRKDSDEETGATYSVEGELIIPGRE